MRSRRKRKAWGASPRNHGRTYSEPANAGDRGGIFEALNLSRSQTLCRPLTRATDSFLTCTWGSASLHPRLYAFACFAGWAARFREIQERVRIFVNPNGVASPMFGAWPHPRWGWPAWLTFTQGSGATLGWRT